MARKKVIMTFDDNNNAHLEVEGCTGSECAALTKELEAALGSVKADTKKKEFYAMAKQENKVQQ